MELFHLKTPYLDCPQCFFYNSRALSGTPYIGIAKQEPEGAEPLMDVTANLSDEVPLGCIAVKDYSEKHWPFGFPEVDRLHHGSGGEAPQWIC